MKKSKCFLVLLMTVLLLFAMASGVMAAAVDTAAIAAQKEDVFAKVDQTTINDDSTITFLLEIQGISDTIFYDVVTVPAGDDGTAVLSDALTVVDNDNQDLTFTMKDSPYGKYISSINGESEATFGGYDGWIFRVNGEEAVVSISQQKVEDGDYILLYYSDAYGEGFQIPQLNQSFLLDDGVLTFTSYDTSEEGTPVTGATVTWYYDGGSVEYKTDSEGQINVAKEYRTPGSHQVQIEKLSSKSATVNGKTVYLPLVLRFTPDIMVFCSGIDLMKDVKADDWYYDAVDFALLIGYFKGTTPTTFSPEATMTRAMFVTVLGRMYGVEDSNAFDPVKTKFEDVDASAYYASHVAWATEEGIVKGVTATAFNPNGYVTREEMCAFLVRFATANDISFETGQDGDIVFADAAKISKWAQEEDCVDALLNAGIINGYTDTNTGIVTFKPQNSATRAEVATIFYRFFYRGLAI